MNEKVDIILIVQIKEPIIDLSAVSHCTAKYRPGKLSYLDCLQYREKSPSLNCIHLDVLVI